MKRRWNGNYTWFAVIAVLLMLNLVFKSSFPEFLKDGADQLANKVSNTTTVTGLKDAAAKKGKHIGIASQTYYLNDSTYSNTVKAEFDILTPEYQMKMSEVQAVKGAFDFAEADKFVAYAQKNKKLVRGHTLIWHDALPAWVTDGQFTRDEWIQIMKDHITNTVSHFAGKVSGWDVVNEAFWTNGQYRPTVWYNNIGPEYIELAFQFAHEADPAAKLYYNDFDTEVASPKSDAVYNLLKNLKAKGVPVDGVGFQTHITIDGVDYAAMKANFQRFAALGLDTDITELDMITHTFTGTYDAKMQAEANVYANIIDVALSLPSVKSIITWGLKDDHSWLNTDTGYSEYPLLFDNGYKKKPAYNAVLAKLNN